jgi:mannitol/fructose-specific phosphotransferase system IIA component (Ntr-type)
LLLNRIDTPLEFEEKDEKKQSNPHIDIILDSISENETHLFFSSILPRP